MSQITFYPIGDADTCLIKARNKNIIVDFADMRDPTDSDDKRCKLSEWMRKDLGWPNTDTVDVVVFTHLDNDHINGSSEFFWLDYAEAYQGEGRVKIKEMWVPANAIVETGVEDEAWNIRAEARHRLKKGYGIKVFSRPEHLKEWFEKEGIDPKTRNSLICDAGQVVPGVTLGDNGVEFFIHAPFAERDGDVVLDRNDNSIVLHATFEEGTQALLTDDITQVSLDKIVETSERHNNHERLKWDLMKCPHHCSYLSLNEDKEKKGKTKTTPTEPIKRLLKYAKQNAKLVITSNIIENTDQVQPPHFQALNTYKEYLELVGGKHYVTMESPNKDNPQRLTFDVTYGGLRQITVSGITGDIAYSDHTPRNG